MNLLAAAIVLVSAQLVGTTQQYYIIELEVANNTVVSQPVQIRYNFGPDMRYLNTLSNTWTVPGENKVTIWMRRESSPRYFLFWVGECCIPPTDALVFEAVAPPRRRPVSANHQMR